jgi:7-carboxy-7-deazaguanine synthase
VKFVIAGKEDYLFANELCRRIDPPLPSGHILYSPADGKLGPECLARWILNDGLDVRLHLRLHRIIWPEIPRGV